MKQAYNDSTKALLTIEGFSEAFQRNIKNFPTHEAAYEQVEESYFYFFGKRKYTDYESFRVTYSKWSKKKNKKRNKVT